MKINVGRLDRLLRLGISLVLIYIGFINKEVIPDELSSNIVGTIGVLNLIVAIVRFCPLYIVAGINTCQTKK
ncbi:MAG: DUF2892 domain-containing protein [Gammaproteobacteria bacterium]|jgi:hypothetical protein|nr:DUF2892 domain-containing protein [Gammaproteobacteria bacterium]